MLSKKNTELHLLEQNDAFVGSPSQSPSFEDLVPEYSLAPVRVEVIAGHTDEETALDREELLIALQCEV